MIFNQKNVLFVDPKDLSAVIEEDIFINKEGKLASSYNVTITHIPSNISASNNNFLNQHNENRELYEILEFTFYKLSALYKKQKGNSLELNLYDFFNYFDSIEQQFMLNPSMFSKEPEFESSKWDYMLDKFGNVEYEKKSSEFIHKDSLSELNTKMKNHVKEHKLSEESYKLFLDALNELESNNTHYI